MKGLREQLDHMALELGFDRLIVTRAVPLTAWRNQAGTDPHWRDLAYEPNKLLPGATRAILLLRGYRPYAPRPGLATVSAYYPCSQRAYMQSAALCTILENRGYRALPRPNLPYKPMLALSGAAAYGRNGVTAAPGLGSRYCIQALLTDAPLEEDLPADFGETGWPDCGGCQKCVAACPVGALDGVEPVVARCLRALPHTQPVPLALRPRIGNSMLGCDLCQDVCPRNRGVGHAPMSPALSGALALDALIKGQVKPLIPLLGANYARKGRIQARACLVAANAGRTDLIPLIAPLTDDPFEPTRVHARWALDVLGK